MNAKLCKLIIFAVGAAIGAVVSASVTKRVVSNACWDECDKEMSEQFNRHKDEMKAIEKEKEELRAEISRVNLINKTLSEKLAKLDPDSATEITDKDAEEDRSGENEEPKEAETSHEESVRRKYWHSDSEELEEITEEEAEADVWDLKERGAYRIDEATFDTTALEYMKEDLYFYMYDGKVVSEDGEWLDNYANFVGTGWEKEPHNNGDYIFVRNDYFATDYKITFMADFGEGHITISDDWED